MPSWAEHDTSYFWNAADQYERANGSTYREFEVALPRELTADQRQELVSDFIKEKIGNSHAYEYAIHCPQAAIEGEAQPHAHIMYCERIQDGIERDPDKYFKRYNSKSPEKGGCKKVNRGTKAAERKAELKETRKLWADLTNKHLERHGHAARVDHRTLEEQGIDRDPEQHLGGAGVRHLTDQDRAAIVAFRSASRELQAADAELGRLPIDFQKKPVPEVQKPVDPAESMTIEQLDSEIRRVCPENARSLASKDPAVMEAHLRAQEIAKQEHDLRARAELLELQKLSWPKEHPIKNFLGKTAELQEIEAEQKHVLEKAEETRAVGEAAGKDAKDLERETRERIEKKQGPALARLDKLEDIRKEKIRERQQQEKERAENTKYEKHLVSLVGQREDRSYGFRDTSEEWQVTPPGLKGTIDALAQIPKREDKEKL